MLDSAGRLASATFGATTTRSQTTRASGCMSRMTELSMFFTTSFVRWTPRTRATPQIRTTATRSIRATAAISGSEGFRARFRRSISRMEPFTSSCPRGPRGTPAVEMRDREVNVSDVPLNWVRISYAASSWTVTDSIGRSHVVSLSTNANSPELPERVTNVSMMGFGGTTSSFGFTYHNPGTDTLLPRPFPHQNNGDLCSPAPTVNVRVPLLASICYPTAVATAFHLLDTTPLSFTGPAARAHS